MTQEAVVKGHFAFCFSDTLSLHCSLSALLYKPLWGYFFMHILPFFGENTGVFAMKGVKMMIEQDTIRLLRECDAGVKMGISSIEDVIDRVQNSGMQKLLANCKQAHLQLHKQIQQRLDEFQDEGKNPNPIAKSMSWMKTNFKLGIKESDKTIASLMTDGCNMGVKSLNQYLNEYEAAEEYAKDITKKLIALEQSLADDLKEYL